MVRSYLYGGGSYGGSKFPLAGVVSGGVPVLLVEFSWRFHLWFWVGEVVSVGGIFDVNVGVGEGQCWLLSER